MGDWGWLGHFSLFLEYRRKYLDRDFELTRQGRGILPLQTVLIIYVVNSFVATKYGVRDTWSNCPNLPRHVVGVGRAKTVMRRWGYLDDAQSVDCDCREPQTMAHLLSCRLLDEACTADDLATVTERAKACARKWEKIVRRTRKKTW